VRSRVGLQAPFEDVAEGVPTFVQRVDRFIGRIVEQFPLRESLLVIDRDAVGKQLVGRLAQQTRVLRQTEMLGAGDRLGDQLAARGS